PVFDFRPDDLEWLDYKPLLERARQTSENTMSGPYLDESGRPYFEIYLVENESQGGGRLIALVDAEICLANLLMDESPGYAVDVIWKDVPLYSRGEAAKDIPLSWTREGMIESSLGAFWRVVHAPTQELADTLEPPSIDFILLLGLIIAVLMATLTSESWRAYSRAHAAEVAEKSLAELNRDLEHEIELRTRELAHRNEDLQTIADSVAHDMRNPLNGIAMNLQLLEEKNADLLDKSSLDILQRISPAVDQMAAILDRMLGMSRAAHSTFSREPLDMNALVKETFDELTANEPPPRVSLELADLPAVDADEMLVKMLLTNLLSNALKYTREKEKRRIQVNYEAQDGVTVYRITDNGIGFDQQSTERMFEAFKRLDSSKATAGIGLGLAIVARVVGRHGGRIWAKGIPGEQASFYFSLEPTSTGTETDSGLAQNP
ncbi:MAG TPA: ATP-binding protein, partial [Xanthomonadales bacterium]|nr:ATP-binding protein [Xanthomonadales bacterium]